VRITHPGRLVKLGVQSGPPPAAGLSLRLLESRRCKEQGLWLYPGDEVRLTAGPDALDALAAGATHVELGATLFPSTAQGTLSLRAEVDGELLYAAEVPLSTLPLAAVALAERIKADAPEFTLTLRLDSREGYLLLTTAALTEPPRLPLGER
jgi:hypothetical protein